MNKKYIIITCCIAIVTFVIGYFVGDASAVNRVNKQISQNVKSTVNENAETTDNQKDKADSSKEKVYKLGEEGKSGNWNIKVLEAKEATTIQSGDGSDNKTTQQKFIIIKLQMTNISQAAVQYSDDEFILINNKDKKQYEIDTDVSLTANQVETVYKKNSNFFLGIDSLNPNIPRQTYLVFEVPKDFNLQNGILMHGNGEVTTGFNLK